MVDGRERERCERRSHGLPPVEDEAGKAFDAQKAGRVLERSAVGSVPVDQDEAPEAMLGARAQDGSGKVAKLVRLNRQRAPELDVLVRHAHRDGREEERSQLVGRARGDVMRDEKVGVERKVWPMLFDGADRKKADRSCSNRLPCLRPRESRELCHKESLALHAIISREDAGRVTALSQDGRRR
jgi:hypothetical protein